MNMNLKLVVPAVLAAVALSACSSTGKKAETQPAPKPAAQAAAPANAPAAPQTVKVDSIDGKKEVFYKCGKDGNDPLSVMYGAKGKDIVVAQVKYHNQLTPNLFRVIGANEENAFWGDNVAWVAEKADLNNVDKVNGNMLTIRGTTTVDGTQQVVDQIVTKYCVLDKAATAKANKAAPVAKKAKK